MVKGKEGLIMKRLKVVLLVIMILMGCVLLTGCSYSTNQTKQDIQNTLSIGDKLASKQPTPQDINVCCRKATRIYSFIFR